MSGLRQILLLEAVQTRLGGLPDWALKDGKTLTRELKFPDFKTALEFVNRIAEVAEKQEHHPDIRLTWGAVGIEIWTHDAGGLTELDFQLADSIDQLWAAR